MKLEWKEDEKAGHLNVHQYFYGLHFFVAIVDTLEASLKLWEGTVFQDLKEVMDGIQVASQVISDW